jgi:hypothetical protein
MKILHAINRELPNVTQDIMQAKLKCLNRQVAHAVTHAKAKRYADICSRIHYMQMEPRLAWEHIRLLTKGESAHHQQCTAMAMRLSDGPHPPMRQKTCLYLPCTSNKSSTIIALLMPLYLSTSHNNKHYGNSTIHSVGKNLAKLLGN